MTEFGYMTLKTAADLVGCHVETLRRAVRQNQLTVARVGRGYQTKEQWLSAWIETRTIQSSTSERKEQHSDGTGN